ncbi:MAG TPA: S-methyl-5'-thioinosine phosphorylase [Gammaproteobacteria bacterium]|nr:S-methyl-5'-thioinosine phosphorylase [Gammaproteobacteria bacterium]
MGAADSKHPDIRAARRPRLGIIGGSGMDRLEGLELLRREPCDTRWGKPSSPLLFGRLRGADLVFLARHGLAHDIPPHAINYRANIQALADAGVHEVVAVAAVGGIGPGMEAGTLVVPDQLIDYTWGRAHSFFDGPEVVHIDFTYPYTESLRQRLLMAGQQAGLAVHDGGVYGATQGPRLETAAEIARMARDGCTLVGMTGMPEAALAREAGLAYATLAVVANRAAGLDDAGIRMEEIYAILETAMGDVRKLLKLFMNK